MRNIHQTLNNLMHKAAFDLKQVLLRSLEEKGFGKPEAPWTLVRVLSISHERRTTLYLYVRDPLAE